MVVDDTGADTPWIWRALKALGRPVQAYPQPMAALEAPVGGAALTRLRSADEAALLNRFRPVVAARGLALVFSVTTQGLEALRQAAPDVLSFVAAVYGRGDAARPEGYADATVDLVYVGCLLREALDADLPAGDSRVARAFYLTLRARPPAQRWVVDLLTAALDATPDGRRWRAAVDACRAGDPAAVDRFLVDWGSPQGDRLIAWSPLDAPARQVA